MKDEHSRVDVITIVVVGPVPPTPGGVAASTASILDALRSQPGVQACHLNWTEIWRLAWCWPQVIHYNFSKPVKRLLGSLIGWCMGSRVVHTIHGNNFAFNNLANRITMYISDGFVLVNERIYRQFYERRAIKHLILMTPVLLSTSKRQGAELDVEVTQQLDAIHGRRIAAVYAYSKAYKDGVETYGFKFIADLLPQLDAMGFSVLFLDIQGKYDDSELDPHGTGNAIHMNRAVDFRALCRRIDVYIRPTATDGNSVAVLEALDEGIQVIASDIVPRPEGTILYEYGNDFAFLQAMRSLADNLPRETVSVRSRFSTVDEYLQFLSKLC